MTKGKRKKRTWIIVGVASTVVIALVVAAIVLLTRGDEETAQPAELGPTLSLEDLLQGKLNPEPFNGTWLSDKELLFTDATGDLLLYDLENMKKTVILSAEESIIGGNNFEISADKQYIKIAHSFQKIYRHSFRAKYTIINLNNHSDRIELSYGERFDFLLTVWSPVGNGIAFVLDNNLYYKPSIASTDAIQITSDGAYINNGIPDWVYEEEVFSSNKALWFSPDGTKLAFGKFNDTQVQVMVLPIYGEPGNRIFQYPRANVIKYPKTGTKNPIVSLHYVNLATNEIKTLSPPSDLSDNEEEILSAVSWATNDTVTAIWMNRIQNKGAIISYLIKADSVDEETNLVLDQPNGWLELFTPPLFSKDGSNMVLILSSDQENGGSFRHLVFLPRTQSSNRKPLTKGNFVVTEILGWDHAKNLIYYSANTATDSAVQHIYSVSVDTEEVKCLSCGVKSKNKQIDCSYNVAEFSKDCSHYVLTCAGPDVPHVALYSAENKELLVWEVNEELQELIQTKRVPEIRKFTFSIEGNFKAQVSLKLPPNFDAQKKYPMLLNVYAGPDSFQVVDKFNVDWGSYLAANKSIIYATIDGRSSGLKGDDLLFASYRKLGTVEIDDQISVTQQIQKTLSYVDPNKTAVWGWSYGGYASGMILANDKENTFKCGMSVAPVTDWTLYDSIYTERFMGLPTINDNFAGYRNASLLLKYEGLRNKQYFLIHGTYDDNVHYQQSMQWAKVLEQNDILFRQLSYPDEDHGLGSVRPHLYHSLENFLDECFI